MQIKDALNISVSIGKLTSLDLPINQALKLKAMRKDIEDVSELYNEKRKALIEEHGNKNDKGLYSLSSEAMAVVNEALAKVADEEVEIALCTFKIEDLGPIKLSADDLEYLELVLELEPEEEETVDDKGDVAA